MINRLYYSFYIEPENLEEKERINENIKELKMNFSKYQKKLLLNIIDDEGLVCDKVSFHSFAQGFILGCKLTTEIYTTDANSYIQNYD